MNLFDQLVDEAIKDQRDLSKKQFTEIVQKEGFWEFLVFLVGDLGQQIESLS